MKKPSSGFALLCCLLATHLGWTEIAIAEERKVNSRQTIEDSDLADSPLPEEIPMTLVWQLKQESQTAASISQETIFPDPSQGLKLEELTLQNISPSPDYFSGTKVKIRENLALKNSADLQKNTTYRFSLSQDLNLGIGISEDRTALGLGKILHQSGSIPWQGMASEIPTAGDSLDFKVNVSFQPSPQLGIDFDANSLSSQLAVNLQPLPGLTLSGKRNSRDESLSAEVRFNQKMEDFSLSARASQDTNDNWRWGVSSTLGDLNLSHQSAGNKNRFRTDSEISYKFGGDSSTQSEFLVQLNYETRYAKNDNDFLTTVRCRYRLGEKTADGKNRWEFNLGYGVGSQGSGALASISTNAIDGVTLRASYQSISLTSDDTSIKIELLPINF